MREIKIFYCYAREDQIFRDRLERHLSNLKRLYRLNNWHERKINPGEIREKVIDAELNRADLIFLLISPDFMASDYCYQKEMQQAIERHKKNEAVVVPILVRRVHWEGAPFSGLEMLPSNGLPIAIWADHDEAFYDVVIGIKRAIQKLLDTPVLPIVVPHQVKSEPQQKESTISIPEYVGEEGQLAEGAHDFIVGANAAPEAMRLLVQNICVWAVALEKEGLVRLYTYHGKRGVLTLLPRLHKDDAGLVSIYNNHGNIYIQFWRSVFERRAPHSLSSIEQTIAPIKQGNTHHEISDELLIALTSAYHEAVSGICSR
jgi:TIR domain